MEQKNEIKVKEKWEILETKKELKLFFHILKYIVTRGLSIFRFLELEDRERFVSLHVILIFHGLDRQHPFSNRLCNDVNVFVFFSSYNLFSSAYHCSLCLHVSAGVCVHCMQVCNI